MVLSFRCQVLGLRVGWAQWKKGAGMDPHPFSLLLLLYRFVGSDLDKVCGFISLSYSWAYGEIRGNGGLTRFKIGRAHVGCRGEPLLETREKWLSLGYE